MISVAYAMERQTLLHYNLRLDGEPVQLLPSGALEEEFERYHAVSTPSPPLPEALTP